MATGGRSGAARRDPGKAAPPGALLFIADSIASIAFAIRGFM
jgi:hypothetical protein